MIILGIDPGTATTGFGIIRKDQTRGAKPQVIDYGCIRTSPDSAKGDRLKTIHQELNKIIKRHKPDRIAVENIYFFKNLKTAMPVSEAKGVILFTAAKHKIPAHEFTPLQVKMTVAGYGRAEKKQVQRMVKILLNLEETKDKDKRTDDAADALGIALCGILQSERKIRIS